MGRKRGDLMMVRQREEEAERLFQVLKGEFEAQFRELIPGIMHALANPLNGILGRSELLGGRVPRILEPIVRDGGVPDDTVREGCRKVISDIGLITEEANRLFDLFNRAAGKFRVLDDSVMRGINLSALLEDEVTFLQFYPDARHGMEKQLVLDGDMPEVAGVISHYSLSFAAILRHAIHSMQGRDVRELVVETGHDDSCARVTISDSGVPLTKERREAMLADTPGGHRHGDDRGVTCALSLLRHYGARLQMGYESGYNSLSVRIPFRAGGE